MSLPTRFATHLAGLGLEPGTSVVVAVSGGPDSVALLDLLVCTAGHHRLQLVVGHVDHGIHPQSAAIAGQVAELAGRHGLPFHSVRLRSLGPEASETLARERRSAALRRIRATVGARYIMTAHHADDQAETVLMRVLRGSGPAGLAAMAAISRGLVRPLLPFRRTELADFLAGRASPAWEDPANRDPRHLRSWLRHHALPRLRERLPDLDIRLLDVVAQAASDRAAWEGVLEAIPALEFQREPDGISVAAAPLGGYDSPLTESLLRAAARRAGLSLGPRRAARIAQQVRIGRSGTVIELGGGWAAELSVGRLRLARTNAPRVWDPPLMLAGHGAAQWNSWRFQWRTELAPARQLRDGRTAWFPQGSLTLRLWRPGDRLAPLGGRGHRRVVRCFQDARIPRRRRNTWPLFDVDGTVVWIPGVCRAADALPLEGTESLRVDAGDA